MFWTQRKHIGVLVMTLSATRRKTVLILLLHELWLILVRTYHMLTSHNEIAYCLVSAWCFKTQPQSRQEHPIFGTIPVHCHGDPPSLPRTAALRCTICAEEMPDEFEHILHVLEHVKGTVEYDIRKLALRWKYSRTTQQSIFRSHSDRFLIGCLGWMINVCGNKRQWTLTYSTVSQGTWTKSVF